MKKICYQRWKEASKNEKIKMFNLWVETTDDVSPVRPLLVNEVEKYDAWTALSGKRFKRSGAPTIFDSWFTIETDEVDCCNRIVSIADDDVVEYMEDAVYRWGGFGEVDEDEWKAADLDGKIEIYNRWMGTQVRGRIYRLDSKGVANFSIDEFLGGWGVGFKKGKASTEGRWFTFEWDYVRTFDAEGALVEYMEDMMSEDRAFCEL